MKRLEFEKITINTIRVWNKKSLEHLGFIKYFKNWKCYVWTQDDVVIMSEGCLQEVLDYMKKIKGE